MAMNRIPLNSLRVFDVAARCATLRQAAEALSVTPGAVSQQVATLEASLGLALFHRTGRRLTLTAEGARLAVRIGKAFEQIDAAVCEAREATSPNVLRLRMSPTLAARWLVPRLPGFSGRHPELALEISTSSGQEHAAESSDVDFTIRLAEYPQVDPDALLLFPDALVPVCSASLAARLRSPSDLANFPLLHSMMRECSWQIWLDAVGVSLEVGPGVRFENAALAYEAAIEGLGVAIAQQEYVRNDLRDKRLAMPFNQVARTRYGYYLVNPPHKRDWAKVRALREWIRAQPGA